MFRAVTVGGGDTWLTADDCPCRARSTPSMLTYLGTALLCSQPCSQPCSQGLPQALDSAHTSDALLGQSLPRLLLGCPSGHPAHTQFSHHPLSSVPSVCLQKPRPLPSLPWFSPSLGWTLPAVSTCSCPALGGHLLAASQTWPANHPHTFPRSPAGDTPSQGPAQPPLLALGQLQSPMTLQTSEQVEAVPHNTTGLGGGAGHTERGKDGTGQQCKSALLEGPVHHGHRGSWGA